VSLLTLCTRPVTLVRRTRSAGSGPYGEDVLADGERVELRAQLHQQTSDEYLVGQDTVRAGWVCVLPDPSLVVGRDDVVEVDGARFEIVGEPYLAWHPLLQRHHHWELQLTEVVG
jgi:hypothetical protein